MISQQLLVLMIALLVPIYLIISRREKVLLAWITLAVSIQIFDCRFFINMPAARLAGLMLIPSMIYVLPSFLRTGPGRCQISQFLYLVLLGIIFGFILPWPNNGFNRGFNQIASGRTIIYLIRTLADVSIAFFVARQVSINKNFDVIVKYFLLGTSLTAVAGIIELITQVDLYGLITGLEGYNRLPFRVRGLNYEPRALGLVMAYGLFMAIIIHSRNPTNRHWALIILQGIGLAISGSTAAYVAAVFGTVVLYISDRKTRRGLITLSIVGFLGYLAIRNSENLASIFSLIQARLSGNRFSYRPENVFETIAFSMEIFDGPAFLFLVDNPLYLTVGTGPGLVSLPATAYMPMGTVFTWLVDTGINCPPTMGILLELANAGILGLGLWIAIVLISWRSLRFLSRFENSRRYSWNVYESMFLVASAIYIVQVSPLSAIWPIFVGLGIGATYLSRKSKKPGWYPGL